MTFKNLIHIVEGDAVLDHWLAAAFAFGGAMQFAFIALPEALAATLAIHL